MTWWVAGATLVGSAVSASGSRSAARTQAEATNRATDLQTRQYEQAYADQQPYREQGVNALRTLAGDINRMPTAAEVMAQPGYQFGLQQGQQALQRQFAARGGRVSGAAMKAATEYGTNYATTGFNVEYQRRQDRLNRLAALAGIGQTATQASGQAGMSMAGNVGNMIQSQGDATGAARMAQGNIWSNALGDIGAAYARNRQQQTMSNSPSNAELESQYYLR